MFTVLHMPHASGLEEDIPLFLGIASNVSASSVRYNISFPASQYRNNVVIFFETMVPFVRSGRSQAQSDLRQIRHCRPVARVSSETDHHRPPALSQDLR